MRKLRTVVCLEQGHRNLKKEYIVIKADIKPTPKWENHSSLSQQSYTRNVITSQPSVRRHKQKMWLHW